MLETIGVKPNSILLKEISFLQKQNSKSMKPCDDEDDDETGSGCDVISSQTSKSMCQVILLYSAN